MNIREAMLIDAPQIAYVQVSSWQTTYLGIVPENYLKKMDVSERTSKWQWILAEDKTKTFVAENGEGEIVGFANGGPERTQKYGFNGELYAIYILKEYQHRGIGRKLVQKVAETLKLRNYHNMLVWVLKDNPSKEFYKSFDPEKVDAQFINIDGQAIEEIAYGWYNLTELCDKLKNKEGSTKGD